MFVMGWFKNPPTIQQVSNNQPTNSYNQPTNNNNNNPNSLDNSSPACISTSEALGVWLLIAATNAGVRWFDAHLKELPGW